MVAQGWQKSYTDKRKRPVKFQVGDKIFLKVPPARSIKRFEVRGKLSLRYMKPYEIIEKLNPVAY